MTADIEFECSHCGQHLVVDSAGAGSMAHCPKCDRALIVPGGRTMNGTGAAKKESEEAHDTGSRGTNGNHGVHTEESHSRRVELSDTNHAISSLERELTQLRSELERAEKIAAEAQAERNSLAGAVKTYQSEVSRLQAEGNALHESLELSRHRLSAMEAHLGARERELSQVHSALSTTTTEMDDTRAYVQKLSAEVERLNAESIKSNEYIDQLGNNLAEVRTEAAQTAKTLQSTIAERDTLNAECAELKDDNGILRHDLAESESGRELMDLRQRIKTAEAERHHAERLRDQSEAEMKKLAEASRTQRADLESLLNRCKEAEKKAESVSEPVLHRENEVLRGIVERQKAEMERNFGELLRLRSARFGLRIAYLLFGASLAGLVVLAMKVVPRILQAGGM